MADEKYTHKSREALLRAQQMAAAAGNPNVEGLHLLAALLAPGDEGTAYKLLRAAGTDPEVVLKATSEQIAKLPRAYGDALSAPQSSRAMLAVLDTAKKRAKEMGDEYISVEHLLVGLAAAGGQAATVLRGAGAGPD